MSLFVIVNSCSCRTSSKSFFRKICAAGFASFTDFKVSICDCFRLDNCLCQLLSGGIYRLKSIVKEIHGSVLQNYNHKHNDKTLGEYNQDVDVEQFLYINGTSIAEHNKKSSGAVRYEWTENGISVFMKKTVLNTDSGITEFIFKKGFTVPLGYSFSEDYSYLYNIKSRVWGENFDKIEPDRLNKNAVKSFGVKSRFVHFEFFRLNSDCHLGKKGEIVALEVNMRPSGGCSPDMMNYANHVDVYEIWADMICGRPVSAAPAHTVNCAFVGRRNKKRYALSHTDVLKKYADRLTEYGPVDRALAPAMGDFRYIACFDSEEEVYAYMKDLVR